MGLAKSLVGLCGLYSKEHSFWGILFYRVDNTGDYGCWFKTLPFKRASSSSVSHCAVALSGSFFSFVLPRGISPYLIIDCNEECGVLHVHLYQARYKISGLQRSLA